jgi:hypothetical protein
MMINETTNKRPFNKRKAFVVSFNDDSINRAMTNKEKIKAGRP